MTTADLKTKAPQPGETLRLTHRFAAPREAVFRAWTSAEELAAWFGPTYASARKVEVDLRVNGRYSIELHHQDGSIYPLSGSYLEILPPERLVFTWTWGAGELAGIETLVTMEFAELGDTTELTLTHEGLPSETARDMHGQGWTACFTSLDRIIEERATAVESLQTLKEDRKMTTKLTGGCACGVVRYECSADPCDHRQLPLPQMPTTERRAAYMSFMGVPKAAMKITGEVRDFECRADSGATTVNQFCPHLRQLSVRPDHGHARADGDYRLQSR